MSDYVVVASNFGDYFSTELRFYHNGDILMIDRGQSVHGGWYINDVISIKDGRIDLDALLAAVGGDRQPHPDDGPGFHSRLAEWKNRVQTADSVWAFIKKDKTND